MWPDLIAKAKEGGVDVIQTYVFWNLHEPQLGKVFFLFSFHLIKRKITEKEMTWKICFMNK